MKIKGAQLNYTVGDIKGNTDKILNVIRTSKEDLLVFSELCITGYPPMDLILDESFLWKQYEYAEKIVEETKNVDSHVVIGLVTYTNNKLYNSLYVIHNGIILGCYSKMLLPTYDVFDERRYFTPGNQNLIMDIKGSRVGFLICEDCWFYEGGYDINPAAGFTSDTVDLVVSINASPSHIYKSKKRTDVFERLSSRIGVPVFSVNQVGGNDELIFDGASSYYEPSGIVKRSSSYEEDFLSIEFDRYKTVEKMEVVEETAEETMYNSIILGLRDYMRKCGFKKVVVGSSGGIDSALTLALAVDAIGAENVTAITMPSEYSSRGSYEDSEVLCKNLGVELKHIPIFNVYSAALKKLEDHAGKEYEETSLTVQNIQARTRGMLLMAYSNSTGAMLLTTGNKSETAVGYCTLYGDLCGGLNLIGDVYKMEVWNLSYWYNNHHGREIIPNAIIEKVPSAELAPGQKDSDSLPPYDLLDTILKLHIDVPSMTFVDKDAHSYKAYLMEKARKLCAEYNKDYDTVYKDIASKIEKSEYKRRQAPPILKMKKKAFGVGWRMPIAQARTKD